MMDFPQRRRDHARMTAANREEYGEAADSLAWITEDRAACAEAERRRRIEHLGDRLHLAFKATKPHLGRLSPGCRCCGAGEWSCLFITGRCNCRCFYCPTPQDEIGVPTTNRVPFARPADYAAYVTHFGFQGVSLSGGEPLLTPDLSLAYLDAVNRSPQRPRHLWMYTNGTRLTADLVRRLADAGLDELRFDLSAAAYDLRPLRLAVGHIPVVTVEIPAIPEDARGLAELLPLLAESGVDHLNLHQLRLTPHNRPELARRPYTFLHGEKVTVLESELTALALMQQVADRGIDLAVNYCSFVFKHRFQRAAARRNSARWIVKPHESVTENGYIRALGLVGEPHAIARQAERLAGQGANPGRWAVGGHGERLVFHPQLWPRLAADDLQLTVDYFEALLCPHVSYHRAFKSVRLTAQKEIVIERQPVGGRMALEGDEGRRFTALLLDPAPADGPAAGAEGDRFSAYEFITPGLQVYF